MTCIDDSERLLGKLKGVTDPEKKRKTIGAAFIEVFKEYKQTVENKTGVRPTFLVQGTLYPDVIESCPPPGSDQKHSHTIKSGKRSRCSCRSSPSACRAIRGRTRTSSGCGRSPRATA